jgi:hypothetical protein
MKKGIADKAGTEDSAIVELPFATQLLCCLRSSKGNFLSSKPITVIPEWPGGIPLNFHVQSLQCSEKTVQQDCGFSQRTN